MKRITLVLFSALTLCGFSAQAQMTDTLSTLAIQGELTTEGYKAVNQGQRAVNQLQLQQDLASLVAEIQTTHMGNYQGISKENISFGGIRGVDWDVTEDGAGGFIIILQGLDGPSCFMCKGTAFGAQKVEIDGGDCAPSANTVKMHFH